MWSEQNVKMPIKEKADGKNDDISSNKVRVDEAGTSACVCSGINMKQMF